MSPAVGATATPAADPEGVKKLGAASDVEAAKGVAATLPPAAAEASESPTAAKGRRGKGEKAKPADATTFGALFRFATPSDTFLYAVALLAAACNGVIFPLFSLAFGALLADINSPTSDITSSTNR